MSRSASAAPRSPATVEKRANRGVRLPIRENSAALVYRVMSWVTTNSPKAPEPLACMRRSGITSRSKWASFSRNHTSCSSIGPRSEEHTSELQSRPHLVCRLLLEKKKKTKQKQKNKTKKNIINDKARKQKSIVKKSRVDYKLEFRE